MVLHEKGKRLPTLEEYIELMLPMEGSYDEENINQFGIVTTKSTEKFYLVQTSPDGYRMMPGPEFSPRLYRGQTKRYTTCKPQLFRNITSENHHKKFIDLLFWTAKRIELNYVLNHHPAICDIANWNFDGLKFDFDIQSVAQHYQYPTQMLDLTRSRDVALYFATHNFKGDTLEPDPAIGCEAVLYTIDFYRLMKDQKESYRIVPIGIDPLPRSAAQKAFSVDLQIQDDLEEFDCVRAEPFVVTEELASHVSQNVGGNNSLFPFDPFEEFINQLKHDSSIDKQAIQKSVSMGIMPSNLTNDDILHLINERYDIVSNKILYPGKKIVDDTKKEWLNRRPSYVEKIEWRGVADSK